MSYYINTINIIKCHLLIQVTSPTHRVLDPSTYRMCSQLNNIIITCISVIKVLPSLCKCNRFFKSESQDVFFKLCI